mmetsp:Transcript_3362/g.6261  ORF Transcript_3362/g.6261 Transcript_3362/m.6261 type:complete len:228 (-) Transcript_3362:372-1055(-)
MLLLLLLLLDDRITFPNCEFPIPPEINASFLLKSQNCRFKNLEFLFDLNITVSFWLYSLPMPPAYVEVTFHMHLAPPMVTYFTFALTGKLCRGRSSNMPVSNPNACMSLHVGRGVACVVWDGLGYLHVSVSTYVFTSSSISSLRALNDLASRGIECLSPAGCIFVWIFLRMVEGQLGALALRLSFWMKHATRGCDIGRRCSWCNDCSSLSSVCALLELCVGDIVDVS